jgi:hypothetical protein
LRPYLYSNASSSCEPVPTPHHLQGGLSLENAIRQQTVDGLQGALEIARRSSYVPDTPIGV